MTLHIFVHTYLHLTFTFLKVSKTDMYSSVGLNKFLKKITFCLAKISIHKQPCFVPTLPHSYSMQNDDLE